MKIIDSDDCKMMTCDWCNTESYAFYRFNKEVICINCATTEDLEDDNEALTLDERNAG